MSDPTVGPRRCAARRAGMRLGREGRVGCQFVAAGPVPDLRVCGVNRMRASNAPARLSEKRISLG